MENKIKIELGLKDVIWTLKAAAGKSVSPTLTRTVRFYLFM